MKKVSPVLCLLALILALPLSAQQADRSKYERLVKFDKKLDSLLNQGIDSTGLNCLFKIASDGLEVYISNQASLHFVELDAILSRFDLAKEIFTERKEFKPMARVCNFLTQVYESLVPIDSHFVVYVTDELYGLAGCYFYMHDYLAAQRAIEHLIQIDPQDNNAYCTLALTFLYQGQYDRAEPIIQRFKNQRIPNGTDTYREEFIRNFNLFEKEGITHPDVAKARKCLQRQ